MDDLDVLPVRRIASVATLILATATLSLRIDHLRDARQLELSPRAARIIHIKRLHDRVLSYAEQYGRPIFVWTGVRHSSAAESTLYEGLRKDLVEARVRYTYDDETFRIEWAYDKPSAKREDAPIRLWNEWPATAAQYAHARWVVFHPIPPHIRKPFADGRPVR